MIGQITGQTSPAPKNFPGYAWENRREFGRRRAEILQTIDGLHVQSRRGLWRLLLFIVISAAAVHLRDFDLFAAFPEQIREFLGAPPPLALIHVVLAVSSISALILVTGRAAEQAGGCLSWPRFGLSVFFYLLYAVAGALKEFFPAVFAAGLVIFVLEHFTVWSQACRAIREEKERLGRLPAG